MSSHHSSLAVVIVSWNVRDLLRRCLQTVEASLSGSNIAGEIIVVEQASSDGTTAMLRAEFPQVRVLEPGRNLGFAAGNNLVLRSLLSSPPDLPSPPLVLLLNPDTEVVGDALPRLVRYLDAHPEVVAVGPQLRYPDGRVQSSRRRFPTRLTFFWESTPLERLWPANPWVRRYQCADQRDDVEQQVDWLVGAALLVRRDAIVRAGLLDAGFFLYSEELEWQHRLREEGAAIVYVPSAVVLHHEGRSSEQVPATRHIHFQRSRVRLARLWYGAGFAAVLRDFLLLCYTWELGVESLKWLIGHRRSLRSQRIGVYAKVLRSGLR
ncbi:MAG: glycosyltransferase family 2 protein [Chloroflexaceae bacterium]|nr:glycosyltransferase family 2 protein [Chloroflexaceae bacterium]